MAHKLLLDIPGDNIELCRKKTKAWAKAAEKPVCREAGTEWTQDDILKYEGFRRKHAYGNDHHSQSRPEKMPPQYFDMLEERHFIWILKWLSHYLLFRGFE